MEAYVCLCERFSELSREAYAQYVLALTALEKYEGVDFLSLPPWCYEEYIDLNHKQLTGAISAIVFQALAIEGYVNLFGVIELGENVFYTEIEPPKGKQPKGFHYFSTLGKIAEICERSKRITTTYPEKHLSELGQLFRKRDQLVHHKPHPHAISKQPFDYENPAASYSDYIEAKQEILFVYEGLDEQMRLYDEMKANITTLRGTGVELTEELMYAYCAEISSSIEEMFRLC